MPRRRSAETSKEYGSFIVSLLNNSVGLMATGGGETEYAAGLEEAILSNFNIEETQEQLAVILERIRPASIPMWRRFIRHYISEILHLLSHAYVREGQPEPLDGIPKSQYNDWFLDYIGYEWTFKDFVIDIRWQVLA